MRWLYHLAPGPLGPTPSADYAPPSLAEEGFVHCSYRDRVVESAEKHLPGIEDVFVYCIDPRRLSAPVEVVTTPRGPMPHVHGPIDRDAIRDVIALGQIDAHPDEVTGTQFAFVSFPDLTLLDLVGIYDPISRIRTMGLDPTTRCEIVAATSGDVFRADGASIGVERVRPDLAEFDVLVIPGGKGTRSLERDASTIAWLRTFPRNRLAVSVCTGALLLGAMGRLEGKWATTHPSELTRLVEYGAAFVHERVVDAGQVITGGGVTCAVDTGLHVVRRLVGDLAAAQIAGQMCFEPAPAHVPLRG